MEYIVLSRKKGGKWQVSDDTIGKFAPMSKIWAITSGDDAWFDATLEHVVLPESADIKALYKQYREICRAANTSERSMTFAEWLCDHGGREPAKGELGNFHFSYYDP